MADLSTNPKTLRFFAGVAKFLSGFTISRGERIKRQFVDMQADRRQTPAVVLTDDAAQTLGIDKSQEVKNVTGEGENILLHLYGGAVAKLADVREFGESRDFVHA